MRRPIRGIAAAALAGAVLASLVLTPAGAHVNASIDHLWRHLRPKADERYARIGASYTRAQSNDRYARVGAAYTRAQSNDRYAPDGEAYTKAASDARYAVPADLSLVFADHDGDADATSVLASTGQTVASVDVDAPAAGCVSVYGAVEVDNDGSATVFTTRVTSDAAAVAHLGWTVQFAGEGSNPDERQTLAGSGAFDVVAGTTTVALEVVPAAARDFTFNGQSLTATWYPAARCDVTTQL